MILTPIASAIRSPIRSPFDPRRSGASGPVNSATDWYFAALGLANTPWADVSRTGLGTRVDSAGLVRMGVHNLLFPSRPSSPSWTLEGGTTIDAAPVAGPSQLQGAEAARLRRGSPTFAFFRTVSAAPLNAPVFYSLWLRSNTGSGSCQVGLGNTGPTPALTVTLTANWQRVGLSVVGTATHLLYVYGITGTDEIDVAGARVQNGSDSGAADDAQALTTAAARYLPRITHDPVTLSALGLLVEGQGTNLISTNFANWATLAATQNLNAAVAPDGTTTAMHLVETAVTQVHRAEYSLTPSATGAHVSWCYVKAGARSRVYLQNDFGSHNSTAEFNLATGTVVQVTGAGGTPGIRPFNNGWFLIWFSTTPTTTNAGQVRLYIGNPTSNQSYAGDGTSGLYYWGPNTTQGTVPTSDIPNPGTGSAVRVADGTWDLTGSAFTAAWNQAQGTLYFEWIAPTVGFTQDIIMAHLAGNISESLGLYTSGGAVLSMWVRSGGANQANFSVANNIIAGARNKAAFSWGPSGFALVLNGGTVATGAGTVPSPSALRLAGPTLVSGGVLSGIVATSYTRPTQLTGAALQALTA